MLDAVQVSGHWNLERLLESKAPSAEPHGVIAGLTASFLRQIDITELLVNQGEIQVSRGGTPTPYRDLTLKARLAVSHPGKADQEIRYELKRGDAGGGAVYQVLSYCEIAAHWDFQQLEKKANLEAYGFDSKKGL